MKLLSNLKPEQVQVLVKALGSLPKESLQLLLNSPQLLAAEIYRKKPASTSYKLN